MEQTIVDDEKKKEDQELEDEKARKLAMQKMLATGGKLAPTKKSTFNFSLTSPLPIIAVGLLLSMVGFAFLPTFFKQKEAATSRLEQLIAQQEELAQKAETMSDDEKRERTYSVLEAAQDISGGKKLAEKSLEQLAKENSPTVKQVIAAVTQKPDQTHEISWKPDQPLLLEDHQEEKVEAVIPHEEILPLVPESDNHKQREVQGEVEVKEPLPAPREIYTFAFLHKLREESTQMCLP